MEVTANLYHYRSSSLKVRLATQFVRGLPVAKAQAQLQFSPRAAAKPILKLLNSAIANAEHNHKMSADGLYIKELLVTEGATLKRFRPRAFGRAGTIRKRTVHVTMVLADRNALKSAVTKPKEKPAAIKADQAPKTGRLKAPTEPVTVKKTTAKPATKKPAVT